MLTYLHSSFFGPVSRRIVFDNAKVAVKEGLGAYVSKENNVIQNSKRIISFQRAIATLDQVTKRDLLKI